MKRHLMGIVGALSLFGAAVPAMAHETERADFRDERPVRVDYRFGGRGGEWRGRGEELRERELGHRRERDFDGRGMREREGREGWRSGGFRYAPAYGARRWR